MDINASLYLPSSKEILAKLSLKNMESGEQFKIAITDFISEFSKL